MNEVVLKDLKQRTSASSDSAAVRPLEEPLEDIGCSGKGFFSWKERHESFRRSLRPESLASFAEKLGVSVESLEALEVGFDRHQYTFPMKSADGEIVGIRTRPLKGGKLTMAGGSLGLFIPTGVTPRNLEAICEGESDTAAALSLGCSAIGLPGAGQATAEVVTFAERCRVRVPCVLADSDIVGRQAAEDLAQALNARGVACRTLCPPEPFGDLREWLIGAKLAAEKLRAAIDAQPILFPDNWPPGFVQLPNAFMRGGIVREIGNGPFALACLLASFRGGNRKVFPARELLAEILGCGIGTIDRHKKSLQEAGILTWQRGGPGRCNEYEITFGPLRKRRRDTS